MLEHINHIWLFFTERCNLGCDYCFFKYRSGRQLMSPVVFENILEFVRPVAPVEFIFSGGEPLMEAERLKEMIATVRQKGLCRYISVQTNATLLDEPLMDFFRQQEVNIEVGIDGDEATTRHNRPGIGHVPYENVVRGVNLIVGARSPLTATMTVHPHGAGKLLENLKYLAGMGLRSVEVHPAFLEDWDKDSARTFIDQYRRASAWELKKGLRGLMGRGYSERAKGTWDLLCLPGGKVLPNWVFLSFPEDVREQFYLMDLSRPRHSGEFFPQAETYFEALQSHVVSHPNGSYRSISNFNALCGIKTASGRPFEKKVMPYITLCDSLEEIDRKIMRIETWHRYDMKVS